MKSTLQTLITMVSRLFISLLLVLTAIGVFAGQISTEMAKTIAFHFIRSVDSHVTSVDSLALVYASTNADINLYYVFGHKRGFVIVAGDDRVEPILGYSNEGRPFPKKNGKNFGDNF